MAPPRQTQQPVQVATARGLMREIPTDVKVPPEAIDLLDKSEDPRWRRKEPVRVWTFVFAALMVGAFIAAVLILGSEATGLAVGGLAVVVLAVIQMLILREKVFSPCTVADVVGAFIAKHEADKETTEAATKTAEMAATNDSSAPVIVPVISIAAEPRELAEEMDRLLHVWSSR